MDGHYQNGGMSLVWDDAGLTFATEFGTDRVSWRRIDATRRIGNDPGYVQLIVRGHVPPGDPRLDPFSVPVASEADANRLVTTFGWRLVPEQSY